MRVTDLNEVIRELAGRSPKRIEGKAGASRCVPRRECVRTWPSSRRRWRCGCVVVLPRLRGRQRCDHRHRPCYGWVARSARRE